MKGATHFIEIWRARYHQITTNVHPIEEKRIFLESTKESGFKTVAVWNIKPKTN